MLEIDMATPALKRLVGPRASFDQIARGLSFSEGPAWNRRTGEFFYTDIVGDTIWKWTPGAGHEIVMRPSRFANGLTFDHDGRLLVAGWGARTVWRMEHDGSITTLAAHYQGKKLNSPNDIVGRGTGALGQNHFGLHLRRDPHAFEHPVDIGAAGSVLPIGNGFCGQQGSLQGFRRVDVRSRSTGLNANSKLNPAEGDARTGEFTQFDEVIDCLGGDERNVKGFAAFDLFLQTRGGIELQRQGMADGALAPRLEFFQRRFHAVGNQNADCVRLRFNLRRRKEKKSQGRDTGCE